MKVPNLFPTIPNTLEFAQVRLTAAENSVESAKHEWKMAKRKRKETKLAAARAKKQLKRARQELSQARTALAEAEQSRIIEKPSARVRKRLPKKLGKRPSAKRTAARRRPNSAADEPAVETRLVEESANVTSEPGVANGEAPVDGAASNSATPA
jgi:chromosome segregation ATPase